jgi:hypothetical protein
MTISIAELEAKQRAEDLDTTEPDFWLDDVDLFDADEAEDTDRDAARFAEAKTDPSRSVDPFATTLPDETRYRPSRTREEALASFLETVRRVLGRDSE